MKFISFPYSDFSVSKVSFGTSSLYKSFSKKAAFSILSDAVDLGISHFDTSPMYGEGLSEKLLGRFLSSNVSNITVASKVGLFPHISHPNIFNVSLFKLFKKFKLLSYREKVDFSISAINSTIENSLRVLNRDVIDIVFLHEPMIDLIDFKEVYDVLNGHVQKGNVSYFGLAGEPYNLAEFSHCDLTDFFIQTRAFPSNDFISFTHEIARQSNFVYGLFKDCSDNELSHRLSFLNTSCIDSSIIVSSSKRSNLEYLINEISS